ncbi:MAG: alpha/beta hydrolase [Eubacteriales bacterium]|nr:alpha/beta hydrolase [Eubacteriales bacterium]
MVTREEFYVDSVDGIHMIHGYRWYDTQKAYRGAVQLVHGMLEYIERYDELAKYLAERGYFVIGHDHLGHGDSVRDQEELGYVGDQGAVLWLRDMEQIRRMAVSYAPKVPYIMIGHSMGSFLVRRYLIYHGNRVDGAVIMGTGQQSPLLVKTGLLVAYLDMMRSGPKGHSRLLNNLTCEGYAKRYPDNRSTGSWMSRDPQVLIEALQDGRRNFAFTLNAYEALLRTVEEAVDPRRAAKMPRDLPLLLLAGDEDPVGDNGKGVRRFERMLKKIGMKNVTCMIYPEGRHELINDLEKEQVLRDIEQWCSAVERRDRR